MQQHLGRLVGVAKVEVSLADGKVTVFAKEDSRLEPDRIFKATYDSGVSVVEMTMEATGWLERDVKRGLIFKISSDQIFDVAVNEVSKRFGESLPPDKVNVRARIFKKVGKQNPKTLGNVRLELLEVRP